MNEPEGATTQSNTERIDTKKKFAKTKAGWQKRWTAEMTAANKRVRRWHKQGNRINARYQDRRGADSDHEGVNDSFRVNLFHSNTKTLREMIYGNPPKTEVSRKHADAQDDQARVASTILDRMLNNCVEDSGDDTLSVLGHCLTDRLLPGMGLARLRYEYESEIEEVEPIYDEFGEVYEEGFEREVIVDEKTPIEYVHWDDFRWGWARTWSAVPWIGFRTYITKDKATKRFGAAVAKKLNYKNKSIPALEEKQLSSEEVADAWDRAEVWEIWDKNEKQVFWWSPGQDKILDIKDDPLRLTGFWPMPEPMIANPTTSLLLPQPDFAIAQDLYNQIDALETRIAIITTAVRVVGVYDSAEPAIKRMMQEGMENDLIPVENWAAFSEGGAIDGKVVWMPIEEIASVLDKLVGQRADAMALLYEVTGMSEIMRGANGPDRETAEASAGKRQFASVRVQGLSEDFARFASDLMRLRAEVIGRHFSTETIIRQSNIMASFDADIAESAVELIKDPDMALWRIKIEPESLAMLDYQALKRDRMEFIQALAQFMQSAMPLAEMDKNAIPPLLQILKWSMSGFKGSNEIEGVLDKAIDGMLKAGPQQESEEPSPEQLKMQAQAEKHQQSMELESLKHQNNMQQEMAKFQNSMKELQAEMQKELKVIMAEMRASIQEEIAQSQAAIAQDDHEMENAKELESHKARLTPNGSGEGEQA